MQVQACLAPAAAHASKAVRLNGWWVMDFFVPCPPPCSISQVADSVLWTNPRDSFRRCRFTLHRVAGQAPLPPHQVRALLLFLLLLLLLLGVL